MTAEVFSTFVELADDLADRVERHVDGLVGVLVRGGHRTPETMNCIGMPSGLGLSGFSQASVQSLRSMRPACR